MEQQLPPINRHGSCPNCEKGWDGGDILEELKKMDVFKAKTDQEMLQIASNYGYTTSNPLRFTKLETIEMPIEQRNFWRCPHCLHVWDKITNKHYVNLQQGLNNGNDE